MTTPATDRVAACMVEENIRCIRTFDNSYPRLLREIVPAPERLYIRGADIPTNMPLLAIVGTRRCTAYGRRALDALVPMLVAHRIGIVSGLAFGIDAHAHRLALKHNGYTAAVLPGSVNALHVFPSSHSALATDILTHGGTLLSENPPHTVAQPFSFPIRNRIIAGLTHATLVIEAPEKSGALITARHALEYNRLVAAVPGSLFTEVSRGTNDLLKRGAYVITRPEDILEMLAIPVQNVPDNERPLIPEELRGILRIFSALPLSLDEICGQTQLPLPEITRIITSLEIRGLLVDTGGHRYIRSG